MYMRLPRLLPTLYCLKHEVHSVLHEYAVIDVLRVEA